MATDNKTHTLSFRLAEDDYQRLAKRCREAELSQSKYLRYLIRIPIVTEGEQADVVPCIVLDKKSLRRISKELTRWGYHYNQAVHAMNSINYYIAHGKVTSDILDGKAESIECALLDVNDNAQRIVYEIAELQAKQLVED
ncbi:MULTISPECIES: CopG family transcriptional regulator [unclassified Adlercreutzia]|uniref:CopG family transcriptional regulator n=1 Tax=unclassified Adlercreutzia TaxID=2636013 RepID=UPI0013ED1353|nr:MULTISPECIES: CopG family transcriptional regulator [unclassified Adlercreutzia]